MSDEYDDHQDGNEKGTEDVRSGSTTAGSHKSLSIPDDQAELEEVSLHDEQDVDEIRSKHESVPRQSSQDLKRVASNVLTKVASRFTTRSIVNPPPAPDGGVSAWTQVAMGWIVVFTSWGWVNSYGACKSHQQLLDPVDRIAR